MSRNRRIALVAFVGLVAASVTHFTNPSSSATALILLASGLVIGEMLVLRLENGTGVPLSYAVVVVIGSVLSPVTGVAKRINAQSSP